MHHPITPEAYASQPASHVEGIPAFSEVDRYVLNYQQIASDHVESIARTGKDNPFMDTKVWEGLEQSTRDLLLEYVPPGARVLDVGVGLGRILGPLAQYRRFGIDISTDYLVRAREAGIEVAFARIEDMPYVDGYFDAVMVCDVLEHVFDLNACCRQILRVLRPGGTLIARVPYREDLSGYLSEANAYEYVHLRNFDEHSIRLFFEKIMECEVLRITEVVPHLVGAPRMKLRQLRSSSPAYEILRAELVPAPPATNELDVPSAAEAMDSAPAMSEPDPGSAVGEAETASEPDEEDPSAAFVEPDPALVAIDSAPTPAAAARNPEPDVPHPLQLLERAMSVTEEEFINWIYRLRDEHPDLFRKLAPHLVYGLEMNVVVRKP